MTDAGGTTKGPVILDSAEQSTHVSTWTEHLCLQRLPDGKWEIDIRSWEVAGEAKDYEYYDEEAEETVLPDQINGVEVIGTEDEFVVVANLVTHRDDYPVYVFESFDWAEFRVLFPKEWHSVKTWRKIEAALSAYPKPA